VKARRANAADGFAAVRPAVPDADGKPDGAAKGRNRDELPEGDRVSVRYRRALARPSFESHYRELVAGSVERAQAGKGAPRLLRREQGGVRAPRPRGRRSQLVPPRIEPAVTPATRMVYVLSGAVVVALAALVAAAGAVGPRSWWTATPDVVLIVLGALWLMADSRRDALGAAAACALDEEESRTED
jgi:hypothetical protein